MCSQGTIEIVKTFSGVLTVGPYDMDWYLMYTRKAVLKRFIKFCQAGSFRVEE